MANPLTNFTGDHHVIFGLTLILIGGFGAIGSITGRLPAMIAGLFDPSDLVGSSSSGGSSFASVEAQAAGVNPTGPGGGANLAGGIIPTATGIADSLKSLLP